MSDTQVKITTIVIILIIVITFPIILDVFFSINGNQPRFKDEALIIDGYISDKWIRYKTLNRPFLKPYESQHYMFEINGLDIEVSKTDYDSYDLNDYYVIKNLK